MRFKNKTKKEIMTMAGQNMCRTTEKKLLQVIILVFSMALAPLLNVSASAYKITRTKTTSQDTLKEVC